MKFLVLAFDGGGVRMVMQWKILQRLINKYPHLLNNVDVFAGTSAGSILASALATGVSKEQIDSLLSQESIRTIFHRKLSLHQKNKHLY